MTSDTILICGGAGYIGSALTSRILKETNFKVKVFDQLLYGGDSLYPFFNYLDRFKFIRGDLRTFDLDELLNIFPKILKGEIAGRILVDLNK